MSVQSFFYNGKNLMGLTDIIRRLDITKLHRIRFDEYSEKSREQEKKYHSMIGDIAKQAKHLNRIFDEDSWKRLTVAQFRIDCIQNNVPRLAEYWKKQRFELVPGLDGSALVTLGAQTREFPMFVAAGFIEWLYAYGAANNIVWSEPQAQWDERYAA
jgi:hypothetical protein